MIKVYGIQNCDSCKKTQKWFFNESININFHDYRLDGINKEILMYFNSFCDLVKIINKRSTSWRLLPKNIRDNINATNIIELLIKTPTLIKRPVIIHEKNFFIGFQEEELNRETNFHLDTEANINMIGALSKIEDLTRRQPKVIPMI